MSSDQMAHKTKWQHLLAFVDVWRPSEASLPKEGKWSAQMLIWRTSSALLKTSQMHPRSCLLESRVGHVVTRIRLGSDDWLKCSHVTTNAVCWFNISMIACCINIAHVTRGFWCAAVHRQIKVSCASHLQHSFATVTIWLNSAKMSSHWLTAAYLMYSQAMDVFAGASEQRIQCKQCNPCSAYNQNALLVSSHEIGRVWHKTVALELHQSPADSIMKAKVSRIHFIKMPEQIGSNEAGQDKIENLQYCTKLTFHCPAMQVQLT